ncbi:unnamed protein product [Sphagnum tenellum]
MAVVAGSVLLSPFTSALAVVDSSSARDARGFSCYTASTASSAFFRGEGRLDDSGMLQCSYHGWSFQGDGSCAAIPQAASEGPEAKARVSSLMTTEAMVADFPKEEKEMVGMGGMGVGGMGGMDY